MEALSLPHDITEEHGEVFTRRWVVDLILDLCGYTSDRDLTAMRALEPACGSGAFLTAMVERLVRSARLHGADLTDCEQALLAIDLLQSNVDASRAAAERTLLDADVDPELCAQLSSSWVKREDFLLSPPDEASSDFVVGNPPYVRLEAVAPRRAAAYRKACATMGGRADVYIGFYEHGLRALRRGGTLGFICADRWMRNAYGARLRTLIATEWSPTAIVSMTGVDAFEDAVDAYPAITVFRRAHAPTGPLVVDTTATFAAADAAQITALMREPEADVAGEKFRASRLRSWFSGSGGWPHGSPERLAAIADMERRLPTLEDVETGTRVGIGVATGADRVFIVNGTTDIEQERLLPLALPRDLATGEVAWSGQHLVNPWGDDGLVELADWPRMAAYLETHRAQLERRHTARRGRWHKTIDRVIDGLREREKLYVPDFKDVVFPVLDCGQTYPHHNLYWIASDRWDLEVLGGLLMSDVANLFTEAYSVRMRGGYLRFQAQYLRRIRLPSWNAVDDASAQELRSAFRRRNRELATRAALPLYGLDAVPT